MGGRHRHDVHQLLVPRATPVHRLAPQIKLVALVVFVCAAALTPRSAVWVVAVDAALLAIVASVARVPASLLARRVVVVAPFLAVAALVPFIGNGPEVSVGPFELSHDGLWAAWNIATKALLGATASIVLTATTSVPDLLTGMTRLHVPKPVVAIVSFMVRYLDLVVDQLHRMRLAMTARGHDPRWIWQARPIAASAGTLFVRTYERGERVHHAMVARGFTGHLPDLDQHRPRRAEWFVAMVPSGMALAATVAALLLT